MLKARAVAAVNQSKNKFLHKEHRSCFKDVTDNIPGEKTGIKLEGKINRKKGRKEEQYKA